MTKFRVYEFPYTNEEEKLNQLKDFEIQIDNASICNDEHVEMMEERFYNFLKENYPELCVEGIDIILINQKTNKADFRFNLVTDLRTPEDKTLYPFIDWLESDCFYLFLQQYIDTYGRDSISFE